LPPVDSLRCFVAAAEQLSFRRAAAEVALTPAAFSQRIKQLEELVGCTLFDRSPRNVALTLEGQALLQRARVALDELRACRDIAQTGERPVRMTLATRFELGLSWIVPFVADLRATKPNWTIDLAFGSGDEILERLDAGRVDAVVTSAPTARAEWAAEVLHPEHYVFVAAPAYLESRPLRTTEDATEHVLIDIDGELPLARYLLAVCPGLAFADVWRVGTGAAVAELTLAGRGVSVLPRYMIRRELADGRLVALLTEFEPLTDTFRLMYRASSPLRDAIVELAGFLRDRPLR
jgi:DNA-binding transcriptional LysR family regulator